MRTRHRGSWHTVRTVCYQGTYDYGPEYDRRACGGVVHIQELRLADGTVIARRATTTNGRYSFRTPIEGEADHAAH